MIAQPAYTDLISRSPFLKWITCCVLLTFSALAQDSKVQQAQTGVASQETAAAKQQVLWQKMEATVAEVDRNLEGVMGVAILDLTSGQKILLHDADVFPQASSIKVAVLA